MRGQGRVGGMVALRAGPPRKSEGTQEDREVVLRREDRGQSSGSLRDEGHGAPEGGRCSGTGLRRPL